MCIIACIGDKQYYCPTDADEAAVKMAIEHLELEGEVAQDEDNGQWTVGETVIDILYLEEFQQI